MFDVNETLLDIEAMAPLFARVFGNGQVLREWVYQMVASMLDAPVNSLCMIASHVWDTIGAQSAGYSAAVLARTGNAPLALEGLLHPIALRVT